VEATTLLELRDVSKTFHGKVALRGLDLDVRSGETLAVLGASGSGKSVLLKLIIGLIKPEAGRIVFDGQDLVPLDEQALGPARARMSMLFQGGALFDSLSVGDNIAYPLRLRGARDESRIAGRVAETLALVGLAGIEALTPAELSGGMRKRVALARAIAAEPEVILYDEPTTGLDPLGARRIDDLIRSVGRHLRATSILVTHDIASACRVSDRIAMLRDGRIQTALPTEEFVRSDLPAVRELRAAVQVQP
jgi:phospholipid/cholesterol/gamma-HCH transport system ATP-binding protein